ncbi:MAG: hypothetical protein ACI4SG_02825 [Oligosphaeraceae bacterium]
MARPRPLFLPALALLLCLGCARWQYLPPARPVAGMFPTVVSPQCLEQAVRLTLSPRELQEQLDQAALWEPLALAGFPREELALLSRSLERRGYGEVDGRRCPASAVEWVALLGAGPRALRLQYQLRKEDSPRELLLILAPAPDAPAQP